MFIQIVSLVGALMILVAFALSQAGKLGRKDLSYNALNLVGSSILAVIAVLEKQAGFLLLEGSWAVLSFYALAKFWPRLDPK
ncbi:MAG: CBU_0592 family membrane protein [Syntrophothermaceae bacterium]